MHHRSVSTFRPAHYTFVLRSLARALPLTLMMGASSAALASQGTDQNASTCPGDGGGITVPAGFCATVFADNIGHARHLVVAPNGVVYVNTWSGKYYGNDTPPPGGFLLALQDTTGNGYADVSMRFGGTVATGDAGGTGIALYRDALFAETNDRIVRYELPPGSIKPNGPPQTIVSGLPLTGDHPMHPIAIDADGVLYVNLGSATNSCQKENRMPNSAGVQPCTELETRAGIWRYDANRTDQVFSPAQRFVTGLRNSGGIAFDASRREVFATQHGRDQLGQNWSQFYTTDQGANLPAEELVRVERGADYGWPECYFDDVQQKLVLAPEYGGNGGKDVGPCASKHAPIATFPAHWAPNDLVIYSAKQFPTAYRNGAFIAFHGSWNRAPLPQQGYNLVFQPLANGQASGKYVVFADGFAGAHKDPGAAAHRPSGLALGPDGALYVSDDAHGRIWRITYRGANPAAAIAAAPVAPNASGPSNGTSASGDPLPPEGIHPDAGANAAGRPALPAGTTAQQVALGAQVFRGEVGGAACGGCHSQDGKGTPMGADLTSGKWLWGDGSLAAITKSIVDGVPNPKDHTGTMPPKGGADLSPQQVSAVAAYVWTLGHRNGT